MRQRGEVAKERTGAVHLMTQAELDVKEMQESMQNSKHTQVSGACSVTACPSLPGCNRLALIVVAAGCVPRGFPHDALQQGCQPLLDPHRPECS